MSNKMALDALTEIREALRVANETPNGPITDTIWMPGRPETLFDAFDAAIAALQAEPQPEHERNAARLAFMQKQMLAADFDYDGECVLVFQWPRSAPVGADLIRNIDAALLATPPKD